MLCARDGNLHGASREGNRETTAGAQRRWRWICARWTRPSEWWTSRSRPYGQIDIVVNNAGATKRGEFLELTDEDWADGFALKFFGAMRLTRAAWPHLKAAGRFGAEYFGRRRQDAGVAVHHRRLRERGAAFVHQGDGRHRHSRRRAGERRESGKHPHRALPAHAGGNGHTQGTDVETAERKMIESARTTRVGEPEDIAALVAFVVSPEGRFLQGSLIDMDGGATKVI